MEAIYVLIDTRTGKLYQKVSYSSRRGVNAYKSPAKALATARSFGSKDELQYIKVVEYIPNETKQHNP